MNWLLLLVAAILQLQAALAKDAGSLYCGDDNCYDRLGLSRGAGLGKIKKAYRKLALTWHQKQTEQDPEKFTKISRAHEVLSDEKLQAAYHYFLDHPEDSYTNYYWYYHAVYAPKSPLWMVIPGTLIFLSLLQYVKDRVEMEVTDTASRSIWRKESKKPSLRSLVGVKALMLPYRCYESLRWHWRVNVKKEAYGLEERCYLTRRALGKLGIDERVWDEWPAEEKLWWVSKQLWKRDLGALSTALAKEVRWEEQQRLSQSAKYRRFKRSQRNK